jgi:hypothetical protein
MPEGVIKVTPNRVHVIWSASKLFGVSGLRMMSLAFRVLPGQQQGCFLSQHNSELIKVIYLLT